MRVRLLTDNVDQVRVLLRNAQYLLDGENPFAATTAAREASSE
jgi:hypothetical protein